MLRCQTALPITFAAVLTIVVCVTAKIKVGQTIGPLAAYGEDIAVLGVLPRVPHDRYGRSGPLMGVGVTNSILDAID